MVFTEAVVAADGACYVQVINRQQVSGGIDGMAIQFMPA